MVRQIGELSVFLFHPTVLFLALLLIAFISHFLPEELQELNFYMQKRMCLYEINIQKSALQPNSSAIHSNGTYQGLSRDTFEGQTVCCLLLEVSRLSLGVLNGFELLLTGLWPLIQDLGFICTSDVLGLEGGEAGDGEGLHIEPCLRSAKEKKKTYSISQAKK